MLVFRCEYSHGMGNGPGDSYYYNELFYKFPKLIGGCIFWQILLNAVILFALSWSFPIHMAISMVQSFL